MSDATQPDQAPQQQVFFRVFLEAPQRRRWPVAAVLVGVGLTVAGLRLVAAQTGVNVVTPRGIRTVEPGMTTYEVNRLLGKPFALADSHSGLDCFRYGYPNFESPSFVVYSLCYEEARLREISQQRYTAWTISEDGTHLTSPAQ
ncbi:MAG TPA: hypothetical protein VND93_30260 [Myxococcales bacterium]|nr:hypothetical protein [Myxococcales bacterium]